ncbi:MAG: tRNA 2-selenouridine(34) synthase MnmH [Alphaproteobacteria bacterium 32-64-14]|nr:MAG: tRNA 2-selenouridine(34) synthase MnmH [Alphaproteobacteria bacterium 32-64-14]
MSNPGVTDAADRKSLSQFDMIIDVRSPAEFAEDHIPGAVNLPVLDNEERAIVGTIYVQESRFLARRVGAAKVASNISHHLDTALSDKAAGFRPLVYCWRGGQRSNSMALVLAQVGWRTIVLEGGYKTYRRAVQKRLYEGDLGLQLVLLEGGTGCGKTAILKQAASRGAQVVDLEALAMHRGSLFGALSGIAQPSQKWFESSLMAAFDKFDPGRPVLVEAESSKIGNRTLPPALWHAMNKAPRIEIAAPLETRASYLLDAYPEIVASRPLLEAALSRLEVYPGRKRLESWRQMAEAGEFLALIQQVVQNHYDPSYARSSRRDERSKLATIALSSLDETSQGDAAREILAIVDRNHTNFIA